MYRVLIADDSPLSRKTLGSILAQKYEIVGEASDGFECVDLFKSLNPDLVFLDITMPNKDGREALAEILELDPSARVIMVSAVMQKDVIDSCLSVGAKGFVEKASLLGADPQVFFGKIDQILSDAVVGGFEEKRVC